MIPSGIFNQVVMCYSFMDYFTGGQRLEKAQQTNSILKYVMIGVGVLAVIVLLFTLLGSKKRKNKDRDRMDQLESMASKQLASQANQAPQQIFVQAPPKQVQQNQLPPPQQQSTAIGFGKRPN